MKKTKKPALTRKFIITLALVYSVLILATGFSFHCISERGNTFLRETLFNHEKSLLLDRAATAVDSILTGGKQSTRQLTKKLERACTPGRGFVHVILYARTADENFFRVLSIIPVTGDLSFDLHPGETVREDKSTNFMKKSLTRAVVDPDIYSRGETRWRNVYHPVMAGKKKMVVQFMISAAESERAIMEFRESVRGLRITMAVITLLLAAGVALITLLFMNNFSLLLRSLSDSLEKAAQGDLDINLNPAADSDLSQLALSFNSLMDELRDREKTQDSGAFTDLFSTGVSLLKEKRLTESIAIFRVLTQLRPGGFGGFFNLGVAYARNRQYTESLDMFLKAREINPSYEITGEYIKRIQELINRNEG